MLASFGTLLQKKQAGAAPALLTALTSLFGGCGEDLSLLGDRFAPVALRCGAGLPAALGAERHGHRGLSCPEGPRGCSSPRGAGTQRWLFRGARGSVRMSNHRAVCVSAKGFHCSVGAGDERWDLVFSGGSVALPSLGEPPRFIPSPQGLCSQRCLPLASNFAPACS